MRIQSGTLTTSAAPARRAGGGETDGPGDGTGRAGRAAEQARTDADFTDFVAANGSRLRRLAELLTGDPHRAADLTQSALEKAYLRWHRIEADDPLAYVRRILVNQYRDWWRLRRHREWTTDQPPDGPARDDFADLHAQRAMVFHALGTLTKRERQVVVLRFYVDLGEAGIAEELRIATGTVKSTLSRALTKLRALPEFATQVATFQPAAAASRRPGHDSE